MSYSRYYVRLKGRCAGNTPPQVKTNMSVSNSSRENCVGSIEDVTKEQLVEIVVEQQSTIEDLKQRLSEVEDEQQETRRQQAEDRQRIAAVEETVEQVEDAVDDNTEDGEAVSSTSKPQHNDDETTSLEQICALPQHVAEDNLTINQQRARSIASRIDEYAKSVPAGVAITSSRIKRVLTAQEDSTIHRQTVKRVSQFLKQFGDGEVKIKKTRSGKTTVVFTEQLVESVTAVVTENQSKAVTPTVV